MSEPTFTDFLRDQNRLLQDKLKEARAEIARLEAENKALRDAVVRKTLGGPL